MSNLLYNGGISQSGTKPVPFDYISGFDKIVASYTHFLGIKNGKLYSWGTNRWGELGLGYTGTTVYYPTQVGTGNTWSDIAAGYGNSSLGILNGKLYAWGVKGSDMGAYYYYTSPTEILAGTTGWTTCVLYNLGGYAIRNGLLYSWGGNQLYQCGNNDNSQVITPTQIAASITNWNKVYGGDSYGFAITSDGKLYSWGLNVRYDTAQNTNVGQTQIPTRVGVLTNWSDIFLNSWPNYNAGIAGGKYYKWGNNDTSYKIPTQIGSDTDWSKVHYYGGIKTNGKLYSLSNTTFTQIGTDTDWDKFYTAGGGYGITISQSPYVSQVASWDVMYVNKNSSFNAPSGLTATNITPNALTLNWVNNNSNNITGNTVQQFIGTGFTTISSITSGSTSYNVTSLSSSTSYTFRVIAKNSSTGAASLPLIVSTATYNAPSGLTATNITPSGFTLNWVNNNTNWTTGNTIQIYNGSWTDYANVLSATTSQNIIGLAPNTNYEFRVIAKSIYGNAISTILNMTTADPKPINLTATVLNDQANATWTLPYVYGTSIRAEIKPHYSSTWIVDATLASNATAHTYTSLTYGTNYDIRVVLVGSDYPSDIYTFWTPSIASPTGLTYSNSKCDSFDLQWVNNGTNQGSKVIRWYPSSGGTITLATLPSGTTATTITGLTSATAYQLSVANYSGGTYYTSPLIWAYTMTPISLDYVSIRPQQCQPFDRSTGRIFYNVNNFNSGHTYSFYVYDANALLYYSKTGITSSQDFLIDNLPAGCYTAVITDEIYGQACPLYINAYCVKSITPYSLGGVKKLYIAPWSDDIDYNFWSTKDDDYFLEFEDTSFFTSTKIKEFLSLTGGTTGITWYEIPVAHKVVKLDQKLVKVRQGFIFTDTLTVAISQANAVKWMQMQTILNPDNKWIGIIIDDNNQYWTFGYRHGARIDTYNFKTGARTEDDGYAFTFSAISENKLLTAIDENYVNNYVK